jgi:hypothetical protein
MTEAVSTSDMSVNFNQTTGRNIPEDSHLYDLTALSGHCLPSSVKILISKVKHP